jgi:hypothetical protein
MRKLAEYSHGCALWELTADEAAVPAQPAAALLARGHVFVLRAIPGIVRIREGLIKHAAGTIPAAGAELRDFYASGRIPGHTTMGSLVRAIKATRETRWISQQLAAWLKAVGFGPPILLDGGVNRLVLPADDLRSARDSGLFDGTDFARERADGPVEVFMAQPSNIHRDFNREHSMLMCNLWFPLHDLDADETVMVFPDAYRREIFDIDNTADNRRGLGAPVQVALRFGDALLFHGEHMHCSPPERAGGRRHSFDLRIASRCPDDNAHYRYNFWNLNNFLSRTGAAQVGLDSPLSIGGPLAQHHAAHGGRLCANFYCLAVERDAGFQEWGALLDVFRSYPFAEDRYLWAASLAQQRGAPESSAFATELGGRTSQFFWAIQAARFLERAAPRRARPFWLRVLELAGQADALPNLAPVRYRNPMSQCRPDEARRLAKEALAGHSYARRMWKRLRRAVLGA